MCNLEYMLSKYMPIRTSFASAVGFVHKDSHSLRLTEIRRVYAPSVNSPVMEFLNGFLVEVSGHKLESSQTRVFVWFSNLIFPFFKMLFMNILEFSCVADFL